MSRKEEIDKLQKAHDRLVDGEVEFHRILGTLNALLSKDEKTKVNQALKKVITQREKLKEVIIAIK